jgi:hypothetical protein
MLIQSNLFDRIKYQAFYLASVISTITVVANVTPAAAVQLKYSDQGNVNKIEDLVIDGINYDVTFKYDSFLNIFNSPNNSDFNKPTFWDDSQKAKSAVDTIASLLNSQQPAPTQVNNYPSTLIPYRGVVASNGSLFLVNKVNSYITRWDSFRGESEDIFTKGDEQANYAVFTVRESVKSVPECNSAVGVVGLALVTGIISGKKKLKQFGQQKNNCF